MVSTLRPIKLLLGPHFQDAQEKKYMYTYGGQSKRIKALQKILLMAIKNGCIPFSFLFLILFLVKNTYCHIHNINKRHLTQLI